VLCQKSDIVSRLKREILPLQGFKPVSGETARIGLGAIEDVFPEGCFPTGTMHECISYSPEESAATAGFTAGLIAKMTKANGACIWVSPTRKVFPPALKAYGISPENILFVDAKKEKEALWIMEEALKCEGLTAVIGEITNLDFKTSRRLQLATEKSRVTGFILRHNLRNINTIACIARWKISPLPSNALTPGVGFKRWNVELLKVRNGQTGSWEVEWKDRSFRIVEPEKQTLWQADTWLYGSAI